MLPKVVTTTTCRQNHNRMKANKKMNQDTICCIRDRSVWKQSLHLAQHHRLTFCDSRHNLRCGTTESIHALASHLNHPMSSVFMCVGCPRDLSSLTETALASVATGFSRCSVLRARWRQCARGNVTFYYLRFLRRITITVWFTILLQLKTCHAGKKRNLGLRVYSSTAMI